MTDLMKVLQELCALHGPSGNEGPVRDAILRRIAGHADVTVDPLGNIIAHKTGRSRAARTVMVDAHMDEVGLIVTGATEQGFLRFDTLGGIDPRVLLGRRVLIGQTPGVIGCRPVHLLKDDERTRMPETRDMVLDIGAASKAEALETVKPGDTAVFDGDFVRFGEGFLKSKALDDRAGCAILIGLLCDDAPYDFTATFTVQEETGLTGAKTAAFQVDPAVAMVLEATTAADLGDVPTDRQVCRLGGGPAVSVMDRRTLYDRELVALAQQTAEQAGLPCQLKEAVAGGNNAGAIHGSRGGVRTVAVSVPCRYLHSATCVIREDDLFHTARLAAALLPVLAAGDPA